MIGLIIIIFFMLLIVSELNEVKAVMKKQVDYSKDMNRMLYELLSEIKTKEPKENADKSKDQVATLELSGQTNNSK